jgi:hypothetical protein
MRKLLLHALLVEPGVPRLGVRELAALAVAGTADEPDADVPTHVSRVLHVILVSVSVRGRRRRSVGTVLAIELSLSFSKGSIKRMTAGVCSVLCGFYWSGMRSGHNGRLSGHHNSRLPIARN